MINKKNRGANLDRLRMPLFFLGLLFASSFVLTAFEWKTYIEEPTVSEDYEWRELPDETIYTAVALKKPLPPPPVQKPVVDDLVLVDDNKKIDIDLVIPDLKVDNEPLIETIPLKKEKVVEEVVELTAVDVWPSFPGGDKARVEYLMQSVKYPSMAKDAGAQGVVWVEFVVGKNGEIEDAQVVRGVGLGCDEEALRVVNEMPKWIPGKQKGLPVKVRFRLPIKYVLKN